MARSAVVSILTLLLVISSVCKVESTWPNYYKHSCPAAEGLVSKVVSSAIAKDKRVGAGLLRLFFHDCFVEGCDASVLIDSPKKDAEKDAIPNQTLHSLEVIDEAKAELEKICHETVSCADIVAFAASTSVWALGGPYVDLEGGRLDGLVSIKAEALANIPSPQFNISTLKASFAAKGLNPKDLVVLSGAHTIGNSHCPVVVPRLRDFNATYFVDPALDPKYAKYLQKKCPPVFDPNTLLNMDTKTPKVFDNWYYKDVVTKKGLFTSDSQLLATDHTEELVYKYANDNEAFLEKFAVSLWKMGQIGIKSGKNGNIRTNCRSFF